MSKAKLQTPADARQFLNRPAYNTCLFQSTDLTSKSAYPFGHLINNPLSLDLIRDRMVSTNNDPRLLRNRTPSYTIQKDYHPHSLRGVSVGNNPNAYPGNLENNITFLCQIA